MKKLLLFLNFVTRSGILSLFTGVPYRSSSFISYTSGLTEWHFKTIIQIKLMMNFIQFKAVFFLTLLYECIHIFKNIVVVFYKTEFIVHLCSNNIYNIHHEIQLLILFALHGIRTVNTVRCESQFILNRTTLFKCHNKHLISRKLHKLYSNHFMKKKKYNLSARL